MECALRSLDRGQLEAILEHAAGAITVQDLHERLIYANEAAARLTGFPSAETLIAASPEDRRNHFLLFDANGQLLPSEGWPGRWAVSDQNESPAILRFRVLATAEERWSMSWTTPIYGGDGQLCYEMTATQDITKAMQGEARLQLLAGASALLASALDLDATLVELARLAVPQLADWVAVDLIEPAGSLRRMAIACSDPGMKERAEEINRRESVAPDSLVGPEQVIETGQPLLVERVDDEILDQATVHEQQRLLLREMGLHSLMLVPLRARGRVLGAVSFGAAAVSGRRYTRADLELATDLAGYGGLAVDNARQYQDARESLRLRDRVIATILHDLRTPLTTIRGMAQVLLRRAAPEASMASSVVLERLSLVDRAATQMAELLDDIPDLARLEDGRLLELHMQPADLAALVGRVVERSREEETGREIHFETSPSEISGEWDARRLERVLTSLMRNVTEVSPAGTEITVALRLLTEEPGGAPVAEVLVRSEGVAMPLAELSRLFTRGSQRRAAAGRLATADIELAGARQIVEQHGGTLGVESQEENGVTFRLRIPLQSLSGGA